MKKFLSFSIAFLISLIVCVPFSAGAATVSSALLSGYKTLPMYENIFTLEDDFETEYVLLDKTDDGFLVMMQNVYPAVVFDPDGTQKFDPTDENNVAYYLNNTFLNEVLPHKMHPYIVQRAWTIEGANSGGACPDAYTAECKVSLLSFDEYNQYYTKFGVVDHNNEINNWLRSGDSAKAGNAVAAGGVYTSWGKLVSLDATSEAGIRPVFVLSDEFFANVKINVLKIGKNVLHSINKNISADDILNAGYDTTAARKLGYTQISGIDEYVDITIPNEPYFMQDHKYSYFEVDITQNSKEKIKYTIEYTLGDSDKRIIEAVALPSKECRKKIWLKSEKKGVNQLDITVYRNGETVGYDSARICLVDYYERKPLDAFVRHGITAVSWQKEENASRDRTSDESFRQLSDRLGEVGFTKVRYGPEWQTVESERGVYRFSDTFYKRIVGFAENGLTFNPHLIAYGNPAITKREISHKMAAPNTLDAIEAYVDYGAATVDYYDEIEGKESVESVEIWNEPNISSFWQPAPNFLEYSQLLNAAAYKFNKKKPDVGIMAGSITAENNQLIFDAMHRNGMLMYADQISIHPYTYPRDPDERHIVRTPQYLEAFERYGGWMDVSITEVGWPTHDAYNTTSYEDQAVYMVKLLVYGDEMGFAFTNIFSARDLGLQKSYVEHGFGIFEYNDRPKPSVASLTFFNNVQSDALYVGEFEITDGVRSFLYKTPGKKNPHSINWVTETGKEKEYKLKNGEYAVDLFGNRIEGKTITIGKSPVYIFNMSDGTYMDAISHDMMGIYNELTEKLGDKFDFSELKALSEKAENSNGSYSSVKSFIDEYFALCEKYIDLTWEDEDMTYENTALVAYIMFKKGETMSAALESMKLGYQSSIKRYKALEKEIAAKKGDEPEASLLYTDAMMRYAFKYNNRISDIEKMGSFTGKRDRLGYYGYVIDKVCSLAEAMIKHEEPDSSRAIFTYTTQTKQNMYKGVSYSMNATFENLRNKDFDGTAVWVDENGEPIGEEIPLQVKSGEYKDFTIKGTAPLIRDAGSYVYKILYKENGEVIKKQEMDVSLKSLVELDLVASETTLSELDAITVEVKNTFDNAMIGKLILESPDGWVMESEKEINVPSGETVYYSFNIDSFDRALYNEYCFTMRVMNEEGNEVAMKQKMLDFRIMVYDENNYSVSDFEGDITGWEDAYPIYIEAPENPDDINSWKGQNRSMKVLSKWNKDNLYFMVDVYDAVHNNSFTGVDMWQGDSVQIAIDTLIDGLAPNTTTGFREDDYEFGFALTPIGLETYVYYGPGIKAGQIEAQMVKVIRNDELGLTRYLINVPGSYVSSINLNSGTCFGFNIAANDADILLREGYSQYTSGICDRKDTSAFKVFKLTDGDEDVYEEDANAGFYKKIEHLIQGN